MQVKIDIHPAAKSYLETFHCDGDVHYHQHDKTLSVLYSLFRKPEISDTPLRVKTETYVTINIPKFLLDQGKTHINKTAIRLFENVLLILLEKEMFAFLDKTVVKGKIKQKEAIEVFYSTFRLPDFEKDYEKCKKAYYRYRQNLEKADSTK